jgi:hypothetical protein
MSGEKAKQKKDCENIPVSPGRFALAPDEPQAFRDNQHHENEAQGLSPGAVREGVEEGIAGPAQGERQPHPKGLADRADEPISGSGEADVLGNNQQPDSGISQLR